MTKRYLKLLSLASVLAIAAAACGGGGGSNPTTKPPPTTTQPSQVSGGTYDLAIESDVSAAFDPQKEYYAVTWEFYRCCLLRTLLSYKPAPGAAGLQLQPDLATDIPQVSTDGLTWTFNLKPNVHYSAPLDNLTVKAQDIIRALEREACSACAYGGYPFYYSIIKGFDEYSANPKTVKSISGLQAPNDTTLKVTLTEPAGDLPFRFSMPATAPIPPNPAKPSDRLGIAEGHDKDYGRFLVGTGPYMIEGTDQLDFSGGSTTPASGYVPGKSISFVRNKSWDRATDTLRAANVDKIDVTITSASPEDLAAKQETGELDDVWGVPPKDQLQKYTSDPNLKDFVHVNQSTGVRYMSMNLAVPPFDDVHVRKAVNLATDKNGLRDLRGGPAFGQIAGHNIIDSLTGEQLTDFDPYATPGSSGSATLAQAEMKQSKYDTNHDGKCDGSVCQNILTVIDQSPPYPDQTKLVAQNLKSIGLTLDIKGFERTTMYAKCADPNTHVAFCTSPGWFQDYPDGYTFGFPLFHSGGIESSNYSLLGASSKDLQKWGYSVTSVPSVDDQVVACGKLQPGPQRVSCWADLDRTLMNDVVPWVPYLYDNDVDVTSNKVTNWVYDQFGGLTALDYVSVSS